jgi:hypothetical protein
MYGRSPSASPTYSAEGLSRSATPSPVHNNPYQQQKNKNRYQQQQQQQSTSRSPSPVYRTNNTNARHVSVIQNQSSTESNDGPRRLPRLPPVPSQQQQQHDSIELTNMSSNQNRRRSNHQLPQIPTAKPKKQMPLPPGQAVRQQPQPPSSRGARQMGSSVIHDTVVSTQAPTRTTEHFKNNNNDSDENWF